MLALLVHLVFAQLVAAASYNFVSEYSGNSFFDGFTYFDHWDNLTNGDVTFLGRDSAVKSKLTFVNDAGNAVLRVDNGDVPWNGKRDSVRLTTEKAFDIGTVWIIDVVHVPMGCSVWPAIWTSGTDWPNHGEIDIVEGANLVSQNSMSLHTGASCAPGETSAMSGQVLTPDCATAIGCTVQDQRSNSFGKDLNAAGGGVWAAKFDSDGIFMWFWSRNDIPNSINDKSSKVDPGSWGTPAAAFPSSECDIASRFGPQQLVIDITLCGDLAGLPSVYNASTCYTTDANVTRTTCYLGNVIGKGSNYDDAYFEIPYIRAFTVDESTVETSTSGFSGTSSGTTASTTAGSHTTKGASATITAPNSSHGTTSATNSKTAVAAPLSTSSSVAFRPGSRLGVILTVFVIMCATGTLV